MRGWGIIGTGLLLVGGSGCYGGAEAEVGETDDGASTGVGESEDESGDASATDGEEPEDVPPGSVPEPLVSRLDHTQYANTIEDVFGETLTPAERDLIPRDIPVGSAYSTTIQGQFFSAQYVLGYASVARSVVARIGAGSLLQAFGDCGLGEDGCVEAYVDTLGLRLHRRPLTDEQRTTYLDLVAAIEAEANPEDAVLGVAEAMLQSPQFLYRVEEETAGDPGAVYQVDGYEMAARLSFFLWQSGPDEALLSFASGPSGDGAYDPDMLAAQVDRMILDPKFARSRRQFWGDYTFASVAGFSAADPEVREELRESLLATLDLVSGVDGPAQDLAALYSGTDFVMTPAVAALAGAEPKGESLEVYSTDEAEQRQGVLTHPGFLAALGTTSFVGRGLFMSERLLCQHILAPPSDPGTSDAIMDTAMQTEDLTPRGASEFRFGLEPVCLICHTQFEPIAYAFERFDMEGRYTLTDEEGRELFTDGNLPAFLERPDIPFDDVQGLFDSLATDEATYRCMVENMMEYATGRSARDADESVLLGQERFEAEGRTFDGLVRSVAENPQLTYKRTAREGE